MATSVFLSHASVDEPLARKVAAHSQPLEVTTYVFEDDVQGGAPLAKKLEDQIRLADAVIVLLTKNSEHRPSVHTEIGIARALGKPIIPVVELGVDHAQFVFLQGIELIWLDATKIDEALLAIQRSLKRFKSFVDEHPYATIAIIAVVVALAVYLARESS